MVHSTQKHTPILGPSLDLNKGTTDLLKGSVGQELGDNALGFQDVYTYFVLLSFCWTITSHIQGMNQTCFISKRSQ